MRLLHLGHACLLVEAAGARLLVDPGNYAADFTAIEGLDAILLTHQHADHADPDRLPALLAANPGAMVLAEPETAALLAEHSGGEMKATVFSAGMSTTVGAVTVTGVGELHAFNHDGVRRCGNTGFVVSAPDEPTLFHPGDAYDAEPGQPIDVLALPVNAPWTGVRDTLAFANRILPHWVVPIHDALLSDIGREGYLAHVESFTPKATLLADLKGRDPWDVG